MQYRNHLSLVLIAICISGCGRSPENAPAAKGTAVSTTPPTTRVPEKAANIQWTNEQVLAAIRSTSVLPSYLTAAAVEFTVTEAAHPRYAISGKVTFRFETDTYLSVGDLRYKEHKLTLVKPARHKGDTCQLDFQQRFSAHSPQQLAIDLGYYGRNDDGDPIRKFERPLDADSEKAKRAASLIEEAEEAEGKMGGLSQRLAAATELRRLVSEDELTTPRDNWWAALIAQAVRLGYEVQGREIDQLKSKFLGWSGKVGTRPQREQAVAVLKPEVLPEAERLLVGRDQLLAKIREAERFFSEE
ncbi:MAG: hypothetical protein ACOZE5_17995 [Verrucomicrobiota bacterium]